CAARRRQGMDRCAPRRRARRPRPRAARPLAGGRAMKRMAIIAFVVAALAPRAGAHDFNPGVLSLVETSEGHFQVAFTPPVDSTGSELPVAVEFPAACR